MAEITHDKKKILLVNVYAPNGTKNLFYFKGANKPEKFLAHQLKKRKERKIIEKIMVEGKEIIEEKEIKETFLKFYSKLYREDGTREYR